MTDILEMVIYHLEVTIPDQIDKEGLNADDFRILQQKFREMEVKIGLVEQLAYHALAS